MTVIGKDLDYYMHCSREYEGVWRLIFFDRNKESVSYYAKMDTCEDAYKDFIKIIRIPSDLWRFVAIFDGNMIVSETQLCAASYSKQKRVAELIEWLFETMKPNIDKTATKIQTSHVHCFYIDTKSGLVQHNKITIRNPQEPVELTVDDGTGFPESRWCIASKPDAKNKVTFVNILCQKINGQYCAFSGRPFDAHSMLFDEYTSKNDTLKQKQPLKLIDSDFICRYNSGIDKLTKLDISNIIDLYSKFIEQRNKQLK